MPSIYFLDQLLAVFRNIIGHVVHGILANEKHMAVVVRGKDHGEQPEDCLAAVLWGKLLDALLNGTHRTDLPAAALAPKYRNFEVEAAVDEELEIWIGQILSVEIGQKEGLLEVHEYVVKSRK
jgi:hypothetical protein